MMLKQMTICADGSADVATTLRCDGQVASEQGTEIIVTIAFAPNDFGPLPRTGVRHIGSS